MGWLRRKPEDSMDAQALLAQAHAANPVAAGSGFRLAVQDVFSITGRGTVVTGRVETGTVHVGDVLRVNGAGREVTIDGIEMFRKRTNSASVGDNVGLLLRNVRREDIDSGDVLAG
jgi:elongation factor Tu